jgi:hypothetical protein
MATTTPNYGWSVPTSSDYVAQGAVAIETLGDSADATLFTALGGNYPGLRLVKKQTIGTAVASVTVTGAFSATYEAYKVIIAGGVASTNNVMNLQFPSNTTGYYWSAKNLSWAGATADYSGNNTGSFGRLGYGTPDNIQCTFDLVNPFLNKTTIFTGTYIAPIVGGDGAYTTGALINTNSLTSFTINTGAGTLTGGTIYVYGYGAS